MLETESVYKTETLTRLHTKLNKTNLAISSKLITLCIFCFFRMRFSFRCRSKVIVESI